MPVYSEETKAQATAAVLTGGSILGVSRDFHVARNTLKGWVKAARSTTDLTTTDHQKRDLGELVHEYLQEGLITLKAQAAIARDPKYLMAHDPEKLAILHGVLADKMVRIMAGMEKGD